MNVGVTNKSMTDELKQLLLNKELEKWSQTPEVKQTIKSLDDYIDSHYTNIPCIMSPNKVFYHYTEWSGWKFYFKALRYGDFRSIWKHLRDGLSTN